MPLISRSLALPWEIIERVIEHASDDRNLLRSFSLTCRQLRPRSFTLILAQYVFLETRDRVSNFCDFLLEHPELRPLIHSILISPDDFRPFPLANMLPCLSTLLFISPRHGEPLSFLKKRRPTIEIHHSTITCYHLFGKCIHTLSLNHLSFQTSSDLYRLLLAFPMTTQLSCNDIFIKTEEKEAPAMTVLRSRLSNQLQLDTLHVRIYS